MNHDRFAHKAGSYEQNLSRVDNVDNIARAILDAVRFEPTMHIMDFGSGTGLLLEKIAPYVDRVTAIDVSASMNAQLRKKSARLPCAVEILEIDLELADIERSFDAIVSSMTLHHIADVKRMFDKFHHLLRPGAILAIADLDCEDGSFHSEDTGVFHHGFTRDRLATIAATAGFQGTRFADASVVRKPQGDYPVFLLTAFR
jgi:cyclopropane fatty-acyl-phospholipid synthase-like methyltransferase